MPITKNLLSKITPPPVALPVTGFSYEQLDAQRLFHVKQPLDTCFARFASVLLLSQLCFFGQRDIVPIQLGVVRHESLDKRQRKVIQ